MKIRRKPSRHQTDQNKLLAFITIPYLGVLRILAYDITSSWIIVDIENLKEDDQDNCCYNQTQHFYDFTSTKWLIWKIRITNYSSHMHKKCVERHIYGFSAFPLFLFQMPNIEMLKSKDLNIDQLSFAHWFCLRLECGLCRSLSVESKCEGTSSLNHLNTRLKNSYISKVINIKKG